MKSVYPVNFRTVHTKSCVTPYVRLSGLRPSVSDAVPFSSQAKLFANSIILRRNPFHAGNQFLQFRLLSATFSSCFSTSCTTGQTRELNTEALERIGALYKVEVSIKGKPPDERRAYR